MTWILASLGFAFFTKNPKLRKRFTGIGLLLLFIFGNSFLANEAFLLWEVPGIPYTSIKEPYEVGIILTGLTEGRKNPKDRMYSGKGVDRIIHTLELYKLGKIKYILITGATPEGLGMRTDETSENEHLRNFLVMSGVPEDKIIMEITARNTRENALRSAEILNKRFPNQKYLLITSAFHMHRAEGCFKKAGINATAFSTDFHAHERHYSFADLFIPNEGALSKWFVLFHEILGYVIYKIMGYC